MNPRSFVSRAAGKVRRVLKRVALERFGLRLRRRGASPRLGYVVHGEHGMYPGSAHIRVLGRVRRAVDRGLIAAERVSVEEWLANDGADYDVLLVQRDAVPLSLLPALMRRVRRRRIRLVVDVDDDFFSEPARARLAAHEYDPDRLRSIDELIRLADRVLVSTETLAHLVSPLAHEVAVVPNELDPALWVDGNEAGDGVRADAAPDAQASRAYARDEAEPLRVLYMGTATHSEDLALLEPVFDGLRTGAGRPVRLEVVGVTEGAADWFDRFPVPEGHAHYPDFVHWLRGSASRWVAGVAPLTANEFNASKSDLKFLEYSLLGLPTIASSGPSYDDTAAHGARVVSDDAGEWRAALAELMDDPERRAASVRLGRDHVLTARVLGSTHIWEHSLGLA